MVVPALWSKTKANASCMRISLVVFIICACVTLYWIFFAIESSSDEIYIEHEESPSPMEDTFSVITTEEELHFPVSFDYENWKPHFEEIEDLYNQGSKSFNLSILKSNFY